MSARLPLARLALLLTLLAASGACARPPAAGPSAGAPAPATATPAAGARRAITFMVFGDPAELRAYQALVAAYEGAHPGRRVELIHIPDQADYRKRLAADFAAGTPADVMLINYRRYAGFAARGLLEPIGPYLAESEVIAEGDFFPEAMSPFRWRRTLVCLPQNVSSLVIYYNKTLFDEAGVAYPDDRWNWDDFVAVARALTRDLDGDGRADQHGLGIEPSLIRVAPFIWQNRGSLVDDVSTPASLELGTPQALKAIQWFVDLQVVHHVVPDAVAEASEPSEDRFLNGRLGMFVNSRRGVPTYRTITAFDWDVAPLPMNHGRRTNILHADAYCLASTAPDKAAAWAFIEFANSPAGQTLVAASGRTVPSLIAVARSPAFLDPGARPARSDIFIDSVQRVRALPVVENWADIEEIAGDELRRAFYGQASVADAVRQATLRTQEYFQSAP
jgi:multiple sugar transport system substrate-binding protein